MTVWAQKRQEKPKIEFQGFAREAATCESIVEKRTKTFDFGKEERFANRGATSFPF